MVWPTWSRSVHNLILKRIDWKRFNDKQGVVYILHDPVSNHIKIGWTTVSAESRLRDVVENHERPQTYIAWQSLSLEEGLLYRLEQLVLRDLRFYQRTYTCYSCNEKGAKHREWFALPVKAAIITATFWSCWLAHAGPYDSKTGLLNAHWRKRVEESRSANMGNVESFPCRIQHWSRFHGDDPKDTAWIYSLAQELMADYEEPEMEDDEDWIEHDWNEDYWLQDYEPRTNQGEDIEEEAGENQSDGESDGSEEPDFVDLDEGFEDLSWISPDLPPLPIIDCWDNTNPW